MFSNDSITGWIGSSIFIIAQLYQVYHVYNRKRADDVSYPLIFFILIGNAMYTYFGFIDNSVSIFVGNLVTFILILIQFQWVIIQLRSATWVIKHKTRLIYG